MGVFVRGCVFVCISVRKLVSVRVGVYLRARACICGRGRVFVCAGVFSGAGMCVCEWVHFCWVDFCVRGRRVFVNVGVFLYWSGSGVLVWCWDTLNDA